MSVDRAQRLLLLVFGVGLVPVALSYGVVPKDSLTRIYGLGEPDLAPRHLVSGDHGPWL